MTPDTPDIEAEDDGAYEPQPMGLSEDDCLIFDRAEFEQDFNAYAVMFRGGQLWALDKESRQWVDCARPTRADKPPSKFKSVQ
jgi:hypothetical protein